MLKRTANNVEAAINLFFENQRAPYIQTHNDPKKLLRPFNSNISKPKTTLCNNQSSSTKPTLLSSPSPEYTAKGSDIAESFSTLAGNGPWILGRRSVQGYTLSSGTALRTAAVSFRLEGSQQLKNEKRKKPDKFIAGQLIFNCENPSDKVHDKHFHYYSIIVIVVNA